MGSLDSYLAVLADHPFAVVFTASLLEAVGIPLPSRVILILTPAFLITDRDLVGLVIVAALGALLGDHVPYLAGRVAGMRVLALYCRLTLGSDLCVENTVRYFRRFRSWALLMTRFSTGIRIFASACAGCGHASYTRFVLLDGIGTLVYTTACVTVGALVGDQAVAFLTTDRRRYLFFLLVATAFVTLIGYRLWRKHRHGRADAVKLSRSAAA